MPTRKMAPTKSHMTHLYLPCFDTADRVKILLLVFTAKASNFVIY